TRTPDIIRDVRLALAIGGVLHFHDLNTGRIRGQCGHNSNNWYIRFRIIVKYLEGEWVHGLKQRCIDLICEGRVVLGLPHTNTKVVSTEFGPSPQERHEPVDAMLTVGTLNCRSATIE